MIYNKCKNCGKILKSKTNFKFCNKNCSNLYKELFSHPKDLEFYSYVAAAKYFNKDKRTIKKYEGILFTINRSLHKPFNATSKKRPLQYNNQIKWVTCKICGNNSPSSKARRGYCSECTSKGLGKKEQGKYISKIYKGKNNPNYLHGKSRKLCYNNNSWYKLKKELNYQECALTGITENLDCHHILPRWFCKIRKIDTFDKSNIIALNHEYHKVVHHLMLDILLLPNLFFLYKTGAPLLQEEFLYLLRSHKVHEFPVEKLQEHDLFQIARFPGRKKLFDLLPQSFWPLLCPQAL